MRALLCLALGLVACSDSNHHQPPDGPPDGTPDAAPDVSVPPDKVPLVVASTRGLLVWRDGAALAADTAPDLTIAGFGLGMGTTAVAVQGDRLYVGRTSIGDSLLTPALLVFDAAHSLTDTSTPAVQLPRPYEPTLLRVDAGDHLWADEANTGGEVVRFDNASTLAMTATPKAVFHHPKDQLPAFALDPVSDRLYAGQVTGAGIVAWNQASTRSGTPPVDFTFAPGAFAAMAIDGDRLYCASGGASSSADAAGVTIWPHISGVILPPPPVHLSIGYTLGRLPHLAVADDTLAVVARDQNRVFIYRHASMIAGDRAADAVLADHLHGPTRVALAGDRLYVADSEGIAIFSNIATAPVFVAKLQTGVGVPADLVLLP